MVTSIQVYKYKYPPSIGTVIKDVGKRIIIERYMLEKHLANNKNRKKLTTILRNIERHTKGVLGLIDFEYILPIKRSDGTEYDIASIIYHFYIDPESGILILGGEQKHRDQVKNILCRFFNKNTSDIAEIYFKRDPCYALVNKIKKDGPILNKEYRNIMRFVEYYNANEKANHGAKGQNIIMYDNDTNPTCVSKHPTFLNAFNNCESLDIQLRLYDCNAIWKPKPPTEAFLDIRINAEFMFQKNTDFELWVIFIMDTCKRYLLM